MKTTYFFFIIGTSILVSCNQSDSSKKDDTKTENSVVLPYHIDLEKNLNNVRSIPISKIGKELEYIPLETKPKSLLKKITKIEFSKNYIFICDYSKLLQFDRTGKFIRQVGDIGRGPGEYISIPNFCIGEQQEKVFIIGWGINKVLVFDFNGNYLRSFSQAFDSFQFLVNEQDNFAFYIPNGPQSQDSEFSLIILDSVGNTLTKIKNHHRLTGKGLVVLNTPMSYFKNTIRLLEPGVDTLKTLNHLKLESYATFNLGNLKMDPHPTLPIKNPERESAFNRLKEKLRISDVKENEQCLFIKLDFGLSDSSTYFLYNKQTLETTHLQNDGFSNDLDGGISFWPQYIYNDSILIDYKDAFSLKRIIQNNKTINTKENINNNLDNFVIMANDLNETSNPVLIVLK